MGLRFTTLNPKSTQCGPPVGSTFALRSSSTPGKLYSLSLSAWVPCRRKGEAANSPNSRDGYDYIILRDMQEICEHMGNDQVEHAIEFHLELRIHIDDVKILTATPKCIPFQPRK